MKIYKTQDFDGHWFWVPEGDLLEFMDGLGMIEGREYMDAPEAFDNFINKYSKYMTGGEPTLVPEYFKDKETW